MYFSLLGETVKVCTVNITLFTGQIMPRRMQIPTQTLAKTQTVRVRMRRDGHPNVFSAKFGKTSPPSTSTRGLSPRLSPLRAARRLRHQREEEQKFNEKIVASAPPSYCAEVCAAVETRYATSLMLRKQRHLVEVMVEHGELVDLDGEKLSEAINRELKILARVRPRSLGQLDDPSVLLEVPLSNQMAIT